MPAPARPPSAVAWHALPAAEAFARLESDPAGLTQDAARERLARFGPNQLPHAPPPSVWLILARQFASPLIFILAIAAAVSLVMHPDDPTDAVFIAVVLLLNASIGGYQEWRAERSSRALQQLLKIRATVLRAGEAYDVDADEVVPGDVIWLESGNRVPADVRLFEALGLEIDESLLTGESLPVVKDTGWTGQPEAPLADRGDMAHAGSIVVRGRGAGVVVATGTGTAVGQLALDVLRGTGGRPPLLERMERFTNFIGVAVVVAAVVIAGAGVLLRGYAVSDMVLFGIALAVAAIPEGLPVALTVALAVATTRMARRGVIVRRLAAVEGLGSCTLIGSDKTGTLTCNELTVRRLVLPDGRPAEVTGEGFAPEGEVRDGGRPVATGAVAPDLVRLARVAVLCNEGDLHRRDGAWTWRGDPTDVALLSFGHKLGLVREVELEAAPLVNEIPFEPERQYAATFHRVDGRVWAAVKGAPERVLPMCLLADADVRRHLERAEELAAAGYRVLALAEGPAETGPDEAQTPAEPRGLEFLGFAGMIDPLRAGARDAVAACRSAGITVCMITGDHPVTALAIARDLGMADSPEQVVAGRDLEGLSARALEQVVARSRVFARATPRQKLELVDAAQQAGHYVAVTGDGVNDAPALRQANIGVAMGKSGTDVAREAADLVITDDQFATIVSGVEQGRIAYDNVRKVIYLLVSTGAAEILLLGLAVFTGLPTAVAGAVLPLLPAQLLWLNLVTNGIQDVALAFEPGEPGVLERRPRPPAEPIFNRLMIERTIVAGLVMGVVGFAAFCWMVEVGGWTERQARNGLLLLMVFFEIIHIGNCRSETVSAFRLSPFKSPILLGGTLLAVVVHVAAMHLPWTQRILHVEPVSIRAMASLFMLALTITAALEAHKWWWHRRAGRRVVEAHPPRAAGSARP
jgi:magnesium-transporting ATPase (P-type)